MAWQTPKINWYYQDYFNIEDAERIVGNIEYLQSRCIEIFPQYVSLLFAYTTSNSGYTLYSRLSIDLRNMEIKHYQRGDIFFANKEPYNWYTAAVLRLLWRTFYNYEYRIYEYTAPPGNLNAAVDAIPGISSSWTPNYWYEGYGYTLGGPYSTNPSDFLRTLFDFGFGRRPSNYPFTLVREGNQRSNLARSTENPLENKPFWNADDLNLIEGQLGLMYQQIIAKYGE